MGSVDAVSGGWWIARGSVDVVSSWLTRHPPVPTVGSTVPAFIAFYPSSRAAQNADADDQLAQRLIRARGLSGAPADNNEAALCQARAHRGDTRAHTAAAADTTAVHADCASTRTTVPPRAPGTSPIRISRSAKCPPGANSKSTVADVV